MTARKLHSAGLLMYRCDERSGLQVLLAHPGGPFFARKDAGAWSIPKGELEEGEEPCACALREFAEETGIHADPSALRSLGEIRQRGGKSVRAWAFLGDWAGGAPPSNTFELEWPPRSGRMQRFPEIDRLELCTIADARVRINPAQTVFLDRLIALLAQPSPAACDQVCESARDSASGKPERS